MKIPRSTFFRRPAHGSRLLQILLVISLIYSVALILDLIIHPMSPGLDFEGSLAIFDRYIETIIGLIVIVIGIFIMRRLPANQVGPLLIIYGAGTVGWATPQDLGSPILTSLAHLFFSFFSSGVSLPAMIVLLVSFPTGQIFPGRVKPWLVLFVSLMVSVSLVTLMAESPGGHDPLGSGDLIINPILLLALVPYYGLLNGAVSLVVILIGFIGATVSLILRYRAAQLQERLQIKWFIWVLSIILFLILVDQVLNSLESYSAVANSPLALTFLILFYGLLGLAPALGIGLGILRSRLWDIDLVIRRTMLYTTLTAALGGVYFGGVLLLQQVVRAISRQDSPVVVVLSTLAIAALFTPLRRRIQTVIDRRFYRKKYDAIRALEEFSAVARREVELEVLSNKLTSAAQESLQPESVLLWLKKQEVNR